MFTFILPFCFIARRCHWKLLPTPERNETLVVVVPGAPPCEILSTIRGPATHFEADYRVVPARDNMSLDYRDHTRHTFFYCVSLQPSQCSWQGEHGYIQYIRAGVMNCRRAPHDKNKVYWARPTTWLQQVSSLQLVLLLVPAVALCVYIYRGHSMATGCSSRL